jgi:hypothetical protein
MISLLETAKYIPVVEEVDVCVLGGSCTGVFAAVRAARLGAKVAIVEKQNCFGGVATSGLVNIWHSFFDNERGSQIIAGLSQEVIERLKKRNAVIDQEKELKTNECNAYRFNSEELKIELDEIIREEKISAYLHTLFVSSFVEKGELSAIIIENKSGRAAIKAKVFIDATGDGDLCRYLEVPSYVLPRMQPPTYCAKILGTDKLAEEGFDLQEAIQKYGREFGLEDDWGWNSVIPGTATVNMHAETHVFNVNCSDAKDLTRSEMEGRRQVRAIMDIARKYSKSGDQMVLMQLASTIGIRETRHIESAYKITNEDLLYGKEFDDVIAKGSYRVDIHHSETPGITFRYLDGTEHIINGRGKNAESIIRRWREPASKYPTFYQIPYHSLIPKSSYKNLLVCGRAIDAEEQAFSALRVMVNLNQTGEASGVAAYIAIQENKAVSDIDINKLQKLMKDGGSLISDKKSI